MVGVLGCSEIVQTSSAAFSEDRKSANYSLILGSTGRHKQRFYSDRCVRDNVETCHSQTVLLWSFCVLGRLIQVLLCLRNGYTGPFLS